MAPKDFSPWALLIFALPIGVVIYFRQRWFSESFPPGWSPSPHLYFFLVL